MQADPYIYGLSRDHWSFVEIVVQSISALGTLGAVIVSLWLSRRKPKPNVTLTARLLTLSDGSSMNPLTTIALEVDNADFQRICVKHVGCRIRICSWRLRRFWRFREWRFYPFSYDMRFHGASINGPQSTPHQMEQGGTAKFYVGMESPERWEDIIRDLGKRPRKLEFCAFLLGGNIITAAARPDCLALVNEAYRTQQKVLSKR